MTLCEVWNRVTRTWTARPILNALSEDPDWTSGAEAEVTAWITAKQTAAVRSDR